ncbi:MAG: hypothetical protein ACI9F2_000645 [Lysobacterales bacterium]|jgi:uncharacterized protein with PQ loop repeat
MEVLVKYAGLIGGVLLPLFNIPLIVRIIKRKSSDDLSLVWVIGVWVCVVLMTPAGFTSEDIVWRIYSYFNITLFTGVMVATLKYRRKNDKRN